MPDVARTLDLPSGQRFEYWKHILTNTFVPLEVSTPGNGDDFRGLLRGCELGSLRFIEVSAEAHTARRTARLAQVADLLDEVDGKDGVRLAGNVLDLLGTVLTERLDCSPADPDRAHRALMLQITSFIEEHLGEADLA